MIRAGAIPKTILVGIGYADRNQRGRDFLWGYERFYSFLAEELIPYVDAHYRTDCHQERTLVGHSDGGYFTVYAFLQYDPGGVNPFGRFVALSGDFTKNEWAMFNEESRLSQRVGEGGVVEAALFMAVGGKDEVRFVNSNREMANRLEDRGYQELHFKAGTYRSQDHMSIVPYAIPIGLKWVFNG
jgi:enterochelin esterase-like enzyme